jgi:hypothetical protein
MKIVEVPPERFEDFTAIFDAEFDSDPPREGHSRIFACFDGDEPVGFIHAENFVLLGQLYVVPEKRNSTTSVVQAMLNFVQERFDGKACVGAVASEERFERLFAAYGMQKIEGSFHRKNSDF